MSNARRWYIYLVSAISLQAVTWAIIALLRNLTLFGINRSAVAFQVAVLVMGLPVFLIHWLWGERLADKEKTERSNSLRRLYLYGVMAALLGPFLTNLYDLIRRLFKESNPFQSRAYERLSNGDAIIYHLIAIIVLGLLWFYLQRVTSENSKAVPETGGAATIRRLYVLGFSAAGLTMVTIAVIHLLRWIMLQFGRHIVYNSSLSVGLTNELTRIIIGLPLWLIFWRWAQHLYEGQNDEERNSALRKFYLYSAVFIGAIDVIGWSAAILAEYLGKLIGAGASSGDIRTALPIIIGGGLLWFFHAFMLRGDAQYEENTRQAGVRRLYAYLIAAIGFSALLIGLTGVVTGIIQPIDDRDLLAYALSGIMVGLPVWLIPWRQLEGQATETGVKGDDARESTARKIYLYFFIFVATMTALSSSVYIVYRLIDMVLGGDVPTFNQLGEAIALIIIASGVWLYHSSILRGERDLAEDARLKKLQTMRFVFVSAQEGRFEQRLLDEIRENIPELDIIPIWLSAEQSRKNAETLEILQNAELIIGPWDIVLTGGIDGSVAQNIAKAITSSPARKLLSPTWHEGWDWAGVTPWQDEKLVTQTIFALKQLLAGKQIKVHRPMGAGTITLIVIGVFFLLLLVGVPIFFFF
ncbi:MAG: DUF3842 family protein [Anaerolineae bacterium]|jgi:hypothetical protein|nr:DUF3842 family protein [Anaerolineae bacterium]MBT7070907.1 DUF3842 family protein [Anaerolineae bacterium]MBT7324333.1 DUF3842 family protein [Anaerolineae bacterium]MBT7599800.1 DUF3842 family protein [Anaerolineae bacterium]